MARSTNNLMVGTRGSLLARAQTNQVIDQIRAAHPELDVVVEIITTRGDREQGKPLPEIGGKGVFTEELERALLDERIDLAVHSAKDLPTELTTGLALLAVPPREDPRDAWISADGTPFADLPRGSTVGTTSLRRQSQLRMIFPDLEFVGLRGNIDTRIRKVQEGQCDGAVLAMAGLKRSHLEEHVTHPFGTGVMLPAPGQGALALEGRAGDRRVAGWLTAIHDAPSAVALTVEREILAALDAGCRAPVAALAEVEGETLTCEVLVTDPSGQRSLRHRVIGTIGAPGKVVGEMVESLRQGGAEAIIALSRSGEK
jgi:hydroxymethylbilane synthase